MCGGVGGAGGGGGGGAAKKTGNTGNTGNTGGSGKPKKAAALDQTKSQMPPELAQFFRDLGITPPT